MRKRLVLLASLVTAIILTVILPIATAFAHESRDVGKYRLRTGWLNEPALEGLQNAAFLAVTNIEANTPVPSLEGTLQIEITHVPSNVVKTFALEARFWMPGQYVAHLFPTAPGHYRFRIFGTIEGAAVNQTFNSRTGGGGFDDIDEQADLQFPVRLIETRELQGAAQNALDAANEADDAASSARTVGVIGIIIGAAGLVVGASALLASRKKKA
jgi:hypothetical protein